MIGMDDGRMFGRFGWIGSRSKVGIASEDGCQVAPKDRRTTAATEELAISAYKCDCESGKLRWKLRTISRWTGRCGDDEQREDQGGRPGWESYG